MAKAPPIPTPTREQIALVLGTAEAAPLRNLQHAQEVSQAIQSVAAFFQATGVLPSAPAQ